MLARHRRPIAVALALLGLWVTIRSAAPPAPAQVSVAVATHDLRAGATLADGDVRVVSWPAKVSPGQRIPPGQAIGQVLATAISAGEPLTQSRLLGPGLLAEQPAGLVAVTVRVADPAALIPIRAGDRIDVLAAVTSDGWADGAADASPDPTAADGSAGAADPAAASPFGGAAPVGGAERLAARALVLSRPEASTDTASGSGAGSGWAGGALGTSSGAASGSSGSAGVVVLAVDEATASRLAAAASTRPLSVVLLPP